MDNGPGWLPDPEDGDRERYWNGSDWTDRVRPAGKGRSLHLPEHVPELQRALAAATADIDAVEDRLSTLFDRADSPVTPSTTLIPSVGQDTDDPDGDDAFAELDRDGIEHGDQADQVNTEAIHAEFADPSEQDDGDDDAFAELDAALAAEEAEEPETSKRGLFRRRS
jgi:hypothetical protein